MMLQRLEPNHRSNPTRYVRGLSGAFPPRSARADGDVLDILTFSVPWARKSECHVNHEYKFFTESLESGSKVPTIAKARAVICYLGVREAPRAAPPSAVALLRRTGARGILTSSAEPAEADPPSPTAAAEAMAVKRLRRIPFSHSSSPFRTGLSAKAGKIGLTSVSIATELGISQSAVSRAIAHAPEILQREEINGEWLEYQ